MDDGILHQTQQDRLNGMFPRQVMLNPHPTILSGRDPWDPVFINSKQNLLYFMSNKIFWRLLKPKVKESCQSVSQPIQSDFNRFPTQQRVVSSAIFLICVEIL